MENVIDYTIMRKGKRVGKCKIEICPKCGRKGVKRVCTNSKGEYITTMYDHKARIELGICCNHFDTCHVKEQ